ncbi:MAG: 6,7-dimethyl-8-ribityllumazine synthase [Candidatus Mycalebacterium zealandia]|nr:MAG: 6,7-dimethyl-8-ribityllumazine synthase [Candidatus Mycalebacterium zealandia]
MPSIEKKEGKVDAKKMKFAVVASRVNSIVTNPLLEGAVDTLKRHGAADSDITVIKVPGSFEIPFVVKKAAQSGKYSAVVAIGSIIRGQTSHFELLASAVLNGLCVAGLKTGVPVVDGMVTTETLEQAIDRAGGKSGNRGVDAAVSAIEMASLAQLL